MKRNKMILGALFILSVFIQMLYFKDLTIFPQYGFAVGLDRGIGGLDIGIHLVFVLAPLLFVLFFISGSVHELTHHFGKLVLIRNYSKVRLYLKNFLKNVISLAGMVFFEIVVYYLFRNWFAEIHQGVVKSIIMYFLTLTLMVALQSCLELFMPPNIANIMIMIYSFLSYFTAQIIEENVMIKILLFPCLLFGMQNGAVTHHTGYLIYLIAVVTLNLLLLVFGAMKFKKTDIL